ncbi:MAG TPA: SpoIIE family protein phosphatase [Rhodospirillaceae bacterium]|nr:SpoIIE family protein phosphatase [Rhodospirillaceae bacterium]
MTVPPDPQLPDDYHRQLDLIAEMSHAFANSRDLDQTLHQGLARVAAFVDAEAASLFLIDEKTGELVCRACVGPVDITGLRLAPGTGVVGKVVEKNQAMFVKEAGRDPHFGALVDAKTGFSTRSILCAPLSVRSERLGAIELLNKAGGQLFHSSDRQLLRTLGVSAALAISNARLTRGLVEQERLRREVELAAEIQRGMLPSHRPKDCPVAGINRPAYAVSGDFFDILPLSDERVAFAVGDVSGKGINASLLMAKTISLFHCLAKAHRRPGALLAAINAELCETAGAGGTFVTMVAGFLDRRSGTILLANAGHEPPLLHQGLTFTSFDADTPPLGIAVDLVPQNMPETWLALGGGCLYLFTDGLTESSCDGVMLGSQGVERMINSVAALDLDHRLTAIIEALTKGAAVLRDDLTLMAVEDFRPKPLFASRFKASPEGLCELRQRVEAAAGAAGCSAESAAEVVLAVDEAVQNILRHAYHGEGDVYLEIRVVAEEGLEIQLIDFAAPVDVSQIGPRPIDKLRPGGLGTHFIRTIMDQVCFLPAPEGAGNLLRMTKALS